MFKILAILVSMSFLFTAVTANSAAQETPKIDFQSYELHQVRLLEEGVASLEAQLQLIEKAESYIDIEKFIISKDLTTRLVLRALIDKKKSHPQIRIRILLDATPYHPTLTGLHAEELLRHGIEFRLYNQYGLGSLNMRDHRKIIASEKEAIIGGRNLADEYFDLDKKFNFLDRDIIVRGPLLKYMEWSFEVFWYSDKTRSPIGNEFPNMEDDASKYQIAVAAYLDGRRKSGDFVSSALTDVELAMRDKVRAQGQKAIELQPEFEVSNIRFVSDGPDWKQSTATVTGPAIIELMRNAKENMIIENGYLIPDDITWKIYVDHLATGKPLAILTNSRYAAKREFLVNAMTLDHTKKLVGLGANVFLLTGNSLADHEEPFPELTSTSRFNTHAKTLIVDEKICVIGTANFDPRSLNRLNAEMGLIIDDRIFCEHLSKSIETRAKYAALLTPEGHSQTMLDINKAETFSQKIMLLLLPFAQLFEYWF